MQGVQQAGKKKERKLKTRVCVYLKENREYCIEKDERAGERKGEISGR